MARNYSYSHILEADISSEDSALNLNLPLVYSKQRKRKLFLYEKSTQSGRSEMHQEERGNIQEQDCFSRKQKQKWVSMEAFDEDSLQKYQQISKDDPFELKLRSLSKIFQSLKFLKEDEPDKKMKKDLSSIENILLSIQNDLLKNSN